MPQDKLRPKRQQMFGGFGVDCNCSQYYTASLTLIKRQRAVAEYMRLPGRRISVPSHIMPGGAVRTAAILLNTTEISGHITARDKSTSGLGESSNAGILALEVKSSRMECVEPHRSATPWRTWFN